MKISTDKALMFVAMFDLIFTIIMIVIFCLYQSVPDSLIVAVFGATIGETSATALIYKAKKANLKMGEEMEECIDDEMDD